MSEPPPKSSKGKALKQKLTETYHKLRKTPRITPEQKLHLKLDSMKTEASDLNNTVSHLLTLASTFTSRAKSTPSPSAPPTEREPLFERHPNGPPSNYDAQVRAYQILVSEWHAYVRDVGVWEKKLGIWEKTLENLKEKYYDREKKVGKTEHEFIGLDNAGHNLKLRKGELEMQVDGVGLPREV